MKPTPHETQRSPARRLRSDLHDRRAVRADEFDAVDSYAAALSDFWGLAPTRPAEETKRRVA